MRTIVKLFIVTLLGILLGSCSPVYKITHDLSPPKTTRGLACINGCQSQLNQCNKNCSRRYDQCSIKSEQQARKELPNLLQVYPHKLENWLNARERYERDLDGYEFRRDMAEARRDRYLDRCLEKGKKRSRGLDSFTHRHEIFAYDRPRFNQPRPVKPTLTRISAKIREMRCSKNCTCDSKYRLCYTSCGGTVKSNKVCIKNCAQ